MGFRVYALFQHCKAEHKAHARRSILFDRFSRRGTQVPQAHPSLADGRHQALEDGSTRNSAPSLQTKTYATAIFRNKL